MKIQQMNGDSPGSRTLVSNAIVDQFDDLGALQENRSLIFALFVKQGASTFPLIGELIKFKYTAVPRSVEVDVNVIIDDAVGIIKNLNDIAIIGYEMSYVQDAVHTVMHQHRITEFCVKDMNVEKQTCVLGFSLIAV